MDRRDLLLLTFSDWSIAERLYGELTLMRSAVGVGRAVNVACTSSGLRKSGRITHTDDISAAIEEGAAPVLN